MKFLDFRKYISLNIISLIGYIWLIFEIIYKNTSFPPYEDRGEGLVMSYEESVFYTNIFTCLVLAFLFFLLFFLELLLRFLLEKFVFKNNKCIVKDIKFKKLKLIYTIIYSIGLLLSLFLFFARRVFFII